MTELEFKIPDAPIFICENCKEANKPKLRDDYPTEAVMQKFPNLMSMTHAFWEPIPHPECSEILIRRKAEQELKEKLEMEQKNRIARFEKLGFPGEQFFEKSFEKFKINDGNKQAFEAMTNWKDQSFGILLSGPAGCGKTHLITAFIIKQIYMNKTNLVFHKTSVFFDKLRNGYNDGTYEQSFKSAKNAEILFLDDIGTEKVSDWIDEKTTQILDYRMENKLPTFITTNLAGKDLSEKFSQRVVSRVVGCCLPYYIQGKDKRFEQMNDRKKEYEDQWQNK